MTSPSFPFTLETLPSSSRSPWAALQGVAQVEVSASRTPVSGQITLPGSKSFTNRALLLAGFAKGTSELSALLKSDDSFWCLEILKQLGCTISQQGETVRITGLGEALHAKNTDATLPCSQKLLYLGSAGTTARFLPGLLSGAQHGEWWISGSEQLNTRPIAPLITALKELGATLIPLHDETLPFHLKAQGLTGGNVTMSGATSSQFISGILMAAPLAKNPVTLQISDHIVQQDYVRITTDLMEQFGVTVEMGNDLQQFKIAPQPYQSLSLPIEADASTASYFFALAALTGGTIKINNISDQTRQPDIRFIDVLEKMGCKVLKEKNSITLSGPKQLKGNFEIDMRPLSDTALTLAVLAPFADGPITIKNVAHIRAHESDRIAVICQALTQAGIQVKEYPDGLTVFPGEPKKTHQETHDDHRVAMSLALLGIGGSGIILDDPGCVSKTCPSFFSTIKELGIPVTFD